MTDGLPHKFHIFAEVYHIFNPESIVNDRKFIRIILDLPHIQ